MDTCLENGEHKPSPAGKPFSINGTSELIQRATIRLSVKKGSLVGNREFGSLFYQLHNHGDSDLSRLAFGYAVDALRDMPEIMVEEVSCNYADPTAIMVWVSLKIDDKLYKLEVTASEYL